MLIPKSWVNDVKEELLNIIDSGAVTFDAPLGNYSVTNFYVDSSTGKLVVEFDDTLVE